MPYSVPYYRHLHFGHDHFPAKSATHLRDIAMRFVAALVCSLLALVCSSPSYADKRVALVVGNGGYENTAALPNPVNDAKDVAAALKDLGFEVIVETNANKRALETALARFGRLSLGADAALFYYAGHGVQYRGRNYLVPVDARLEDEFSVNYELTRIDDVLFAVSQASGVRLLILDACRNNPLADRLIRSTSRNTGIARGLTLIDDARGMIVAYATQPNQVADDGQGRNSPFTSALLNEMKVPGVEIATFFRRVAADVDRATNGRQFPELSISMTGEFYLNTRETDLQAWARVRDSSKIGDLNDFLLRYPGSVLAKDAQARIAALERSQQASGKDLGMSAERPDAGAPTVRQDNEKTVGATSPPATSRDSERANGGGAATDLTVPAAMLPAPSDPQTKAVIRQLDKPPRAPAVETKTELKRLESQRDRTKIASRSSEKITSEPDSANARSQMRGNKLASRSSETIPSDPPSINTRPGRPTDTCTGLRDRCFVNTTMGGRPNTPCYTGYSKCMGTGNWHTHRWYIPGVARR
jgi:hypothetical protein